MSSMLNAEKSEFLKAAENLDKKVKDILSLLRKTRRSIQKQQNKKFN